jgi:hypothetical protein
MALIMGIGQILLYALGLPLLVFVFLNRHRHELEKPVVRFRYGLFFAGFRKERYYWECIVALRKESIVVLAVFGPSMGTSQLAHVALIVILFQVLVQLVGSPYGNDKAHRRLHVLDVASLIVCWITMWSGYFFLHVEYASRGQSLQYLTIGVIAINALHMTWLVVNMLSELCDENKESALVKSLRRRVSTDQAPALIRSGLRMIHSGSKKKHNRGESVNNPARKSIITQRLENDKLRALVVEMSSINMSKTNHKLRKIRGKKKQEKNKKKSQTPAQRSRRKTMNRVTTKLQSLNRNNNVTGLPNSTTNPIVENHCPVMMDEATGNKYFYNAETDESVWLEDGNIMTDAATSKKYYHDLKTEQSTWLVEEGDSAASIESPNEIIPDQGTEIQILEDENGRRYSWNPITEETAWLDRVENGDEQEEESSYMYDASGGNLFGGTNPMHVIKSTEETKERDRKN